MAETHFQKFAGRLSTSLDSNPKEGSVAYDSDDDAFMVYDGSVWRGIALTTSTSTSTTTSTSTSTTTSTSTSTSTSTTTE